MEEGDHLVVLRRNFPWGYAHDGLAGGPYLRRIAAMAAQQESVAKEISRALWSFHQSIETIRDFFSVTHPHLQAHDDALIKSVAPLAKVLEHAIGNEPSPRKGKRPEPPSTAAQLALPSPTSPRPSSASVAVSRTRGAVRYSIPLGDDFDHETMKRGVRYLLGTGAGGQPKLLGRAALMLLASSAEWFTSQLLHALLAAHPERLNSSDMSIAYSKLVAFESIHAARAFVAESRVEGILRGPVEDWIAQIKKEGALTASYVDEHRDELVEAFVRRNLLVHNGGVVNSIYLARVPESARPGVKAGDKLDVSPEYLENALNVTESVFVLLGAELWKRLDPKDEARPVLLTKIGFHHLEKERWRIAQHCYHFINNDKGATTKLDREVAQVNVWQCRKWLGHSISSELEADDPSALAPLFKLARAALLDEHEDCVTLAKQVLRTKEIDGASLRTWPLFREARKHAPFAKLCEKSVKRPTAAAARKAGGKTLSVTIVADKAAKPTKKRKPAAAPT